MPVGVASVRALAYVRQVLAADSTFTTATPGGIWQDAAPEGALVNPDGTVKAPACILALASAPDLVGVGGVRIWADALVDVRIGGPISLFAAILAAADRADILLNLQKGAALGGTVLATSRESVQSIPFTALVAGQQWVQIVQSYRMPTQ